MPTATGYRGSTQDSSAGVQVAQATAEVTGAGTICVNVLEGNKSTYTETSRTGLTGADTPTGGDMTTTGFAGTSGANLIDLGNALNVNVRATCSVASANLSGRLALYDGSNACIGMSQSLAFSSDPTLRLGNATGDFISLIQLMDVGTARKTRFFVDSISAGTWAVYMRPC